MQTNRYCQGIVLFVIAISWGGTSCCAQDTEIPQATSNRVLETELTTYQDHFPFVVPPTAEEWSVRRDLLRKRVLVSTGLSPMLPRPPINPVIHGKVKRDGFTVEKVYFESLPGHYVSGLLFRPTHSGERGKEKHPGVLSPHGHGGRMMQLSDENLAQQIESGGERYEKSGRFPKLARCAHLARMGCVTFIFDMPGYADSQQIPYQVAHKRTLPRPEEANFASPCFYSLPAELNLQSIIGLQTFNALRALDFLASLPDVDPERLGVTGGSGGGTQSILLGAIDPRVKVSFPNGMISTSMQGGCFCENACYLRIGTGNVELAALFAPKPQGMTAADDWTRDMMTDGFPQLQQLYAMLGHPKDVICKPLLQYKHNYNYVTRAAMYPLMAQHLGIPEFASIVEQDYEPLSKIETKVYNEQHPAPRERGVKHEQKVLAWWKTESDKWGKQASKEDYREMLDTAWRKVIFDRGLPKASDLSVTRSGAIRDTQSDFRLEILHRAWKTSLSLRVLGGEMLNEKSQTLLLVVPGFLAESKDFDSLESSVSWIRKHVCLPNDSKLEDSAIAIIKVMAEQPVQRTVEDDHHFAGYTFTYNRPLAVIQCEQILCAITAIDSEWKTQNTALVAHGDMLVATSAAGVIAGPILDRLIVDTGGFRFANLKSYRDPSFLPGASKYGGLAGLLSLRVPYALQVADRGNDHFSRRIIEMYESWEVASELTVVNSLSDGDSGTVGSGTEH